MRHSCEEGDGLAGYTWTEHDIREGGVQILKDPKNNVQITTELLKFPGGEHGGSWGVRISGKPMDTGQSMGIHNNFVLDIIFQIANPLKASMIFYAGLEGKGTLSFDTEDYSDVSQRDKPDQFRN
jgi:mannosyl-oligosaccharide glucosidase